MPGNPRIYARLYASCWTDERTATLTGLAFCLWAKSLVMCKDKGTDGVFSAVMVPMFAVRDDPKAREAALEELLASGLWVRDGAEIRIPNWSKYQTTNDEIAAIREKKRQAGKAGAEARYGTTNSDEYGTAIAPAMAPAMAGVQHDRSIEIASVPSTEVAKIEGSRLTVKPDDAAHRLAPTETAHPVSGQSRKRQKRASVDPIGWTADGGWTGITDEHRAKWATAFPACDLDRQLAAMGAWLEANPAKATKSRWSKFVVNWLTRSQDRGGDTASKPTVNGSTNGRFRPIGAGLTDDERAARTEKLIATARIT